MWRCEYDWSCECRLFSRWLAEWSRKNERMAHRFNVQIVRSNAHAKKKKTKNKAIHEYFELWIHLENVHMILWKREDMWLHGKKKWPHLFGERARTMGLYRSYVVMYVCITTVGGNVKDGFIATLFLIWLVRSFALFARFHLSISFFGCACAPQAIAFTFSAAACRHATWAECVSINHGMWCQSGEVFN